MIDWGTLPHAYGSANDMPGLLRQLSPDPKSDVWNKLWSRLCHQGSVYSASFAALFWLLPEARSWPPAARVMPLTLAAHIVKGGHSAEHKKALEQLAPIITDMKTLTLDTLSEPALGTHDLVYLSQAKLLFEGDRGWGPVLDNILGGEFQGQCPDCETDFYIVAGGFGFFVTADDWVNNPKAELVSITPASPDQLDVIELWLLKTISARGPSELAHSLTYFFGISTCPRCRRTVKLPDAIKKAVAC
jgi:hypothetical protein